VQFHLGDHLGSSNVVVDLNGAPLNREEFTPYGETSFGSFERKRYRFTAMERDEESGLSYHGARYYSPWLPRWVSPDPIGIEGGMNLYIYCNSSPVTTRDLNGTSPETPADKRILTTDDLHANRNLGNAPAVEKIDPGGGGGGGGGGGNGPVHRAPSRGRGAGILGGSLKAAGWLGLAYSGYKILTAPTIVEGIKAEIKGQFASALETIAPSSAPLEITIPSCQSIRLPRMNSTATPGAGIAGAVMDLTGLREKVLSAANDVVDSLFEPVDPKILWRWE
jgi:RHS repeat-associated protein